MTQESLVDKLKFDCLLRWWVSVISLLIALLLWAGRALTDIVPFLWFFGGYTLVHRLGRFLLGFIPPRKSWDYILCACDVVAITFAIWWTGRVKSPFYFLYFIPLLVQIYHRDFAMVFYKGILRDASLG